MKAKASNLVVQALEEQGVRFTFGIPGTHNIELYDALEASSQITPVLVTDEQGASFMADGVSRTSDSVGVVNVVPGAGLTHALSGIAEAFMDNIPLLVLACGIRSDTGHAFQLHDIDQIALLEPITKAVLRPETPDQVYSTVRRALVLACAGTPGPVAVEVPGDFYILTADVSKPRFDEPSPPTPCAGEKELAAAADLLNGAFRPALYVGYGARAASGALVALAEKLAAPVVTTIQGKGVFPEDHALWLWNNFGASAPSFVRSIMDRCDALLAIGCRFSEVGTASYGLKPPKNLIHVDINDEVFNRNYTARLAIRSDAGVFAEALLPLLKDADADDALEKQIAEGHRDVRAAAKKRKSAVRVSVALFFEALQRHASSDAIYATDSGNGTFLAMENLRLTAPGRFIAPVDYSCMGYCVPAAVGAKLANPNRDVIGLAGDGALLMTGLELITAATYKAAPVIFVLRDGELAQIVQLQRTSFNSDTCSVLGSYDLEALAKSTGSEYFALRGNADLDDVVSAALNKARQGTPVVVEVNIDYTHKTYFTRGIITTNFWRLPWAERLRMIGRAAGRRIAPPKST